MTATAPSGSVKLMALYKQPADVEAFLAHYNDIHIPLVKKIPGLGRMVVHHSETLVGDAYFMAVVMHFPDQATFDAAMASPENRAAGKDVGTFAADLCTLMVLHEESDWRAG
jgi:uncharacterized protein (TIGR02118 family)